MRDSYSLRKIVGPVLPPTILHRESLEARLNEVIGGASFVTQEGLPHYKLVLLCAPAGYGKTTLLADFVRRTSIPCCWYVLDRADTDKSIFLEYLLESIKQRFPQFGAALAPLLVGAISADANNPAGLYHFEAVIDALCVAIATEITERFVLLLCNYHEINESEVINHLVNRLLRKLPPQCVLVIESRAVPSLEFVPLFANREMFSMGSDVLRFTAQEVRDLASLQGVAPLSEVEAEQLAESFGGWIAGILLGTRLGDVTFLRTNTLPNGVWGSPAIRMDRRHLFLSLVNEVFKSDQQMYAFLKEAVVLQQMTPFLCNALLDIPDASDRLHYLEQQGLFVMRSDDDADITYTCHPVLRELLYDELRHQAPERFAGLHRRAAELLRASHNYDQAIFHALEASADDIATSLIIETHEQMLAEGHATTLTHWIDALLAATKVLHPKLLLVRANLHLFTGEYVQALPLLEAASTILLSQSPVIDVDDIPTMQAAISLAHSKALFQAGQYQQVLVLCQQVLAQVAADEVALRAEAHTRLGVCVNLLGDFMAGIAHLQKALQLLGRDTQGRQTAELHSTLASTYSLIGNFALAEHHLARAIFCSDHLNDAWGKVNNLIRLGLVKQRQGAFAEAEAAFSQALTIARGAIHFRRGEAYALVDIGELYQDQGLYDRSLTVTEEGLALARQVGDKYLVNCALGVLAMSYLFMGDASTAVLLVSEIDLQTANGETTGYERVIRELVHGTIVLYQGRYDEAYARLTAVEASLKTMSLKREQIQTTVRIAACQLAQGQTTEGVHRLEEMTTQMMRDDYEQLVLIELRRLSVLQQVVKTLPELAGLRVLLRLETDSQWTSAFLPLMPASTLTMASQPRIAIRALGEPTILIEEVPITHWRMAHSMELFFLLLDYGRPMRKELVITALWPEVDDNIDQTLRSTLYYLRKVLGESCILSKAGTYTLNLASLYGSDVWYDVAVFQEHHSRARQALNARDDAVARTALMEMVNLYRGDYVQSFYSDWCTLRRDELRRAYLDARHELAQIAWRSEQFDESVIHWQQILAVDNCLEDAHYGLMRCYLRQGKRGLALRQYQRCTKALQDELAAPPGQAVQNLYRRLVGSS